MNAVRERSHVGLVALGGFFGLKVLMALVMLKLSAQFLSADGFAIFSQLLFFSALLNTLASGGMQNGLVREIAAAGDAGGAAVAFAAARRIWLFICVGGLALAALSTPLAEWLVSDASYAWSIPLLVSAAALTGLGQLYSAALIGQHRLAANAIAQTCGLVVGTLASVPLIIMHSPALAVVAFAAGNCVTVVAARLLLGRSEILSGAPADAIRPVVRRMLAYAGSFVFVAAVTPTVLFAVRYVYREAAGVEALNEWLVANRISDVSTQLLGLFMAQWYLPHLARSTSPAEAKATTLHAVAIAGAVMTAFLVVFLAGASIIIPLVLSEQFVSARGQIALYMTGDVVRVVTSAALFAALARGRLGTYMALEGGGAALFGVLAIGLLGLSVPQAPIIAYPVAYAILAVLIAALFYLRARGAKVAT